MNDSAGKVLIALIVSGVEDAEERIEKLFDWSYNHAMESVKLWIGFGLSLLASLLFAYMKGDVANHGRVSAAAAVGALATVIVGLIRLHRVKRIRFSYIDALKLLQNAAPVIKRLPTLFTYV